MTGGVESGPHPENCRPCFLRTSAFFTTASPGLLLLKLNVISQLEQGEDHWRVEQGPPQGDTYLIPDPGGSHMLRGS
nr:uncharacterized protein LOC110141199 isoform X4 [Odocoileus virginianus texanus]